MGVFYAGTLDFTNIGRMFAASKGDGFTLTVGHRWMK
jgi:hypothetical protein